LSAVAFAGSLDPPAAVIHAAPEVGWWVASLLFGAWITTTGVVGYFLNRTLKQSDASTKALYKLCANLEHRTTVIETSIQGCCGLPGGRRDYDPRLVNREKPEG
jgi:hypothetical protein